MIFAPEFIFLSEWLYIPFPPPFHDSIMLSQEPFLCLLEIFQNVEGTQAPFPYKWKQRPVL